MCERMPRAQGLSPPPSMCVWSQPACPLHYMSRPCMWLSNFPLPLGPCCPCLNTNPFLPTSVCFSCPLCLLLLPSQPASTCIFPVPPSRPLPPNPVPKKLQVNLGWALPWLRTGGRLGAQSQFSPLLPPSGDEGAPSAFKVPDTAKGEPPAVVSTTTWWSIVGLHPSRDLIDLHLPSPRLLSIGKHPKPPEHAPWLPSPPG